MILQNLKKKYGYEIALNKEELSLPDEDLLESLLILDLDGKIVYSVADFVDKWGKEDPEDEKTAILAIANVIVRHLKQTIEIATKLDPKFGKYVSKQLKKKF